MILHTITKSTIISWSLSNIHTTRQTKHVRMLVLTSQRTMKTLCLFLTCLKQIQSHKVYIWKVLSGWENIKVYIQVTNFSARDKIQNQKRLCCLYVFISLPCLLTKREQTTQSFPYILLSCNIDQKKKKRKKKKQYFHLGNDMCRVFWLKRKQTYHFIPYQNKNTTIITI